MAARVTFVVISIALLIINTSASDENGEIQFSYSGGNGPDKWGNLSQTFSACSNGKSQSPIDIEKGKVVLNKDFKLLTGVYRPTNATLVTNGFSIGIHSEKSAGVMILNGKKYHFLQMHWHSPSEHLIDGVQYAAELHLVHKANDGNISVVGILYQLGEPDPLLAKLNCKLEELAKEAIGGHGVVEIPIGSFNFKQLKGCYGKYYRYHGSLTTPPCSENVTWHVVGKVKSISKEQVEALRAPLNIDCKFNSRPVQQLNGRATELFDELSLLD